MSISRKLDKFYTKPEVAHKLVSNLLLTYGDNYQFVELVVEYS